MFDKKLVDLVERDAELITTRAMKELLTREETRHYRNLPEDRVYDRVYDVYKRLGFWLEGEKSKANIREFYTELGRQRFHEGIPLSEVIMALLLLKRQLWLYEEENKILTTCFEFRQCLEHNNTVVMFFDRCIFFVAQGYEAELASCPR